VGAPQGEDGLATALSTSVYGAVNAVRGTAHAKLGEQLAGDAMATP